MKYVKMISIVFVLSLSLTVSVWGDVAFQDTFETAGVQALSTTAEVGSWTIGPAGTHTVQNTQVSSGDKALQIVRPLGGGQSLIAFGTAPAATPQAGYDMIFKMDYYHETFYEAAGVLVNVGDAGFEAGWNVRQFSGNNYQYYDPAGGYVNTGILAHAGQWVTMELVMHLVDAGVVDKVTGTYDLFVTPAGGAKVKLASNVPLKSNMMATSIARMYILNDATVDAEWGGDLVTYWDNVSIEKVVTPICGSDDYPIPFGDLNEDCQVDLVDFARLAANWLVCTDVDCE